MTEITEEEAYDNLNKAIADYAIVCGWADPETEMLNHWAVVAHWQKIVENGSNRYTIAFHKEEIPVHVAEGLFRTGIRLLVDEDE